MDYQYQPGNIGLPKNNSARRERLLTIIAFVLGFVVLALAIVTTISLFNASSTAASADKKAVDASAAARADQKKADELAARLVEESPYRTYAAPNEFGAFKLSIPKSWSLYANYDLGARTQLTLMINPDIVSITSGNPAAMGCRVELVQQTLVNYLKDFYNVNPSVNKQDITVSGISGKDLSGTFSDRTPNTKRVVILPVRDKVMVFTNENGTYSSEFTKVLEQANIVP